MSSNFNESLLSDVDFRMKELKKRARHYVDSSLIEGKSTKKLYFAGPWFNTKQERFYRGCQEIAAECNGYNIYTTYWPRNYHDENAKRTFDWNIKMICECDTLLALVNEKDVGTAFEIGYAKALGKQVFLMGYDETCFKNTTNIMLAFAGRCFTVDCFAYFLTNTIADKDFETFDETWRNKQ